MIDDYSQLYVGFLLVIIGVYLTGIRWYKRRNGIAVNIISMEPQLVYELPPQQNVYRYKVVYTLNDEIFDALSVEYYISTFNNAPMIPVSSTGVLTKNQKISIDGVYTPIYWGTFFMFCGTMLIYQFLVIYRLI